MSLQSGFAPDGAGGLGISKNREGKLYTVQVLNNVALSAGVETPVALVTVPAGASVDWFYDSLAAWVESGGFSLSYYMDPTITSNGTPVTPQRLNRGGPGASPTQEALVYRSPVIADNGTPLNQGLGWENGYTIDKDPYSNGRLIVGKTKTFLLTMTTQLATDAYLSLIFFEERR